MKTIILSIFLASTLVINAQDSYPYMTFGGGISRPYNKAMFSLTGGYQFSNGLFTEGSMRVVASREIGKAAIDANYTPTNPVHFGVMAGYSIAVSSFDISPMVGYHYRLVSTDIKRLNGWDYSYGLRVRKNRIMAEYNTVGKYSQFTIGFYFKNPNK